MRRRRLISVAAVALLLGAGAAAVYYIQASDKSLLRRSVKVADAKGWNVDFGLFQVVRLPATESPDIYFTKNISGPSSVPAVDLYLRKGWNGPETRLVAISNLIGLHTNRICEPLFSDESKRILWSSSDVQVHIADLDGRHHAYWCAGDGALPPNKYRQYQHGISVLRAPNHNILELQQYDYVTYCRILWRNARTLKVTRRAVLNHSSDLNILRPELFDARVDSKGNLLAYAWDLPHSYRLVDYCRFDLKANGKLLERHRITFPKDTEYTDMCINNTGDRVLWQFTSTYVSSVAALIHRYFPAFPADPQTKLTIYQSQADGRGMHELGYVSFHERQLTNDFKMNWAVGNNCAYFVYEKALYRLPVD